MLTPYIITEHVQRLRLSISADRRVLYRFPRDLVAKARLKVRLEELAWWERHAGQIVGSERQRI